MGKRVLGTVPRSLGICTIVGAVISFLGWLAFIMLDSLAVAIAYVVVVIFTITVASIITACTLKDRRVLKRSDTESLVAVEEVKKRSKKSCKLRIVQCSACILVAFICIVLMIAGASLSWDEVVLRYVIVNVLLMLLLQAYSVNIIAFNLYDLACHELCIQGQQAALEDFDTGQ